MAIIKKAKGYEAEEIIEEYQIEDDVMTLTKKRVSKKHYPPDTQAAKMILEREDEKDNQNASDLSENEIKTKIKMLIEKYKGEIDEERKT